MDSTFKLIIILLSFIQISMQYEYITTIIQEFQLNNLHLIGSSNELNLPLIKSLLANGLVLQMSPHIHQFLEKKNIKTTAIIFLSYHQDVSEKLHLELPENLPSNLIIISHGYQFDELLNTIALQTMIHQKIYLFKKTSQEIYEAYTVNNFVVKNSYLPMK